MRKFIIYFVLLITCGFQSYAQEVIQNISSRKNISLNGRWNYIVDPYQNGYFDYRRMAFDESETGNGGYYDDKQPKDKTDLVEYDFDHSPSLNVPGDWNSQKEDLKLYEGAVWYRRLFNATPQKGKKYIIYFAAANYEAHVYLNGKKLGMHKGGFTAFQFDVTELLKLGANSLVVMVDNTRKQDEVPTINTDWWNYGGITRDVYLAELPDTYLADYKIQLAKNNLKEISGFIQIKGNQKEQKVTINIPEAGIKFNTNTNDKGYAAINIPVKNLINWSPENPKLYQVNIKTETDAVEDKIGFRTISTKGKDILLNGKSVFLRGIAIHDENPLIPGRPRSEADLRMLLTWAKELNCNYVRLAHYPHNEKMMRLADEMGLMVWAEVPVYWTISWENPETYKNAAKQLTDLIELDKNRASVIIWSVGNETPVSEPRNKFMGNLVDKAKSLDDTRLVAAALELHREGNIVHVDDVLGEKLDIVSFNEYAGWYWGGTPKEIPQYKFEIKYPKPVVISELGGAALAGFHGDQDTRWTEEYQEALYENQFKMLDQIDGLRGMTPWILVDFRSPRRPHPIYQNFWNRKGLISDTGVKKKAFFALKSYYEKVEKKYANNSNK
ncbi:Beta-galactosidase [Arcticibacter svalbardensis MN12-7]|uniref:Beta-galactosidase n=1 Tax=Arcticibacter svalbardensis MN12-7 TaxID=1150600 RepID=R9GTS0_9SPHI|nr:glycoside hydrolase family 2 TIM barrel-domain containing protein [Arcticibacter svalbardensis]EOR95237.1 Beta-galactosidase [Arcticibacter svalbardensis MN12-7]